jgi:hypothetical protein
MNSRIKELINPLPGFTVLHVTSQVDELTSILDKMLQETDGKLNLAVYADKEQQYDFSENTAIQYVKDYNKVFRALPRDNDIVLLHNVFAHHTDKDKMLKTAYMTLANAAQIIIMEKKGILDISTVKSQLFAFEFRAANEIDLIEGYDLITARKMHMWGNGL